MEAVFLDSLLGKAFFCTFQILFYAVRPLFVFEVPFTWIHWANVLAQVAFDFLIVRYLGGRALAYFILSSFLAGSLHPCAAHFIAEHYVFGLQQLKKSGSQSGVPVPETFSYYGPLNWLTYNVGYHNEHHDFPAVPWTKLPQLHSLAREFYQDLPHHASWVNVTVQFIMDKEVGMWCRVKREQAKAKIVN